MRRTRCMPPRNPFICSSFAWTPHPAGESPEALILQKNISFMNWKLTCVLFVFMDGHQSSFPPDPLDRNPWLCNSLAVERNPIGTCKEVMVPVFSPTCRVSLEVECE